jgi:PhoH-like ATPase
LAEELLINQFVFQDGRAARKDKDGTIKPVTWKTKFKDFKPKNVEQQALFCLLDNDDIPAKVVNGPAGTGKTLCALKFGLAKVLSGKFAKLVIVRNPVSVGKEVGFLKGTLNDKLEPWSAPIVDNLDGGWQEYERLLSEGKIEFSPTAFIQGRSIANAFILVTEAQNMTWELFKMCGTRVGDRSVIVFDGDEDQVANDEFKRNNGLRMAPHVFGGNPLFGYVRLTQTVRSEVANMFANVKVG